MNLVDFFPLVLFRFNFISIRFPFRFVSPCFVSFRFVSISFRFVSPSSVSFRQVPFRFARFRFVSVSFLVLEGPGNYSRYSDCSNYLFVNSA